MGLVVCDLLWGGRMIFHNCHAVSLQTSTYLLRLTGSQRLFVTFQSVFSLFVAASAIKSLEQTSSVRGFSSDEGDDQNAFRN